jgi:hypothetical protein
MSGFPRTDNNSLGKKLGLRLHVLKEMGIQRLRVLDLCAGKGLVWSEMAKHYAIDSYTPVDEKPRLAGSIKFKLSERLLEGFDLQFYNVIDIDPYGEPWLGWCNVYPRIAQRTAVFLTVGNLFPVNPSTAVLETLGIPKDWNIPKSRGLTTLAEKHLICQPNPSTRIVKAWRILKAHVSYYGLIVEPRQTA